MSGNIKTFNNANLEQRIADILAGILKGITDVNGYQRTSE